MKATERIDWQGAAMDKAVGGSNSHGFEATGLKMVSKKPREMSGDGSVVHLGAKIGTESASQRPSKILSGWTPQKWRNPTKSIHKRTSRGGRSA